MLNRIEILIMSGVSKEHFNKKKKIALESNVKSINLYNFIQIWHAELKYSTRTRRIGKYQ